jgi:hypothetical protein
VTLSGGGHHPPDQNEQLCDQKERHGVAEGAGITEFFGYGHGPIKKALSVGGRETVQISTAHLGETAGKFFSPGQRADKLLRDPKDDAAEAGGFFKNRIMGYRRGDDEKISRLEGIGAAFDHIGHIAFDEKDQFVKIVSVRSHGVHDIAGVIEGLKIISQHMLPGVELFG